MLSRRLDPLNVESLSLIPMRLFFLEPCECYIHDLHAVWDGLPALLDYLTPLFVAHHRELVFYLSSCLSFVHAVRANPLHLDSLLIITQLNQLCLLLDKRLRLS